MGQLTQNTTCQASDPLDGVRGSIIGVLVAVTGLIGALAAMSLPTSTNTAEISAGLALGSVALLAGHRWGLMVVAVCDLLLLGQVLPIVHDAHQWSATLQIAVYAALACALPGLVLVRHTVPITQEIALGRPPSEPARVLGIACASVLSALWLVVPAAS